MNFFVGSILSIAFVQAIIINPNTINDILDRGNHTGLPSIQANADTFSSSNPVYGQYFDAIDADSGRLPNTEGINRWITATTEARY